MAYPEPVDQCVSYTGGAPHIACREQPKEVGCWVPGDSSLESRHVEDLKETLKVANHVSTSPSPGVYECGHPGSQ